MSDTRYTEDCGDDIWAMIRWRGASCSGLRSQRGQAHLADLEAALLAMPARRLSAGAIAADGEVCAVGALGAYQLTREGVPWEGAVRLIEAVTGGEQAWCDDTAAFGQACGLSYTVAWDIGYLNDEALATLSPEDRWQYVLNWVRDCRDSPAKARMPW